MSRTVLVTGASSGIGRATARRLLEEGHTVYGAARRVEAMRDLEARGAVVLPLDLTVDAEIVAAVERIRADRGGVDILINNAGYNAAGPVEHVPLDEARRQFEVNLFGLARLTQLVIPQMRERGAGRIVNVSSVGGRTHGLLSAWYHASKYALEGWSDCLRLELRPFGIDVTLVEPGAVQTEFVGILEDRLRAVTEGTAYASMAAGVLGAIDRVRDRVSQPEVVAETLCVAAQAPRPKTRYVVGYMARPILLLRSVLSDRMFDRLLTAAVG